MLFKDAELQPKTPSKGEWKRLASPPWMKNAYVAESTFGQRVMSDIEKTQRGLEFHISISYMGKKPNPIDIAWVQECFGIDSRWERDDHSEWLASFWLPVNKDMRGDCECKET